MTRFKIVFKQTKRSGGLFKRLTEPTIAVAYGDNYFISDRDSAGYSRYVIVNEAENGGRKKHQFVCNANDVLYTTMEQINEDDES